MSRIFTINTKYYEDYKLFNRKNFTINPGLTILVGCNGSGKTTMMNHIRTTLEMEGVPVFYFDNLHDGGSYSISKALFNNQTSVAATLMCSSEGEKISQNIAQSASRIGAFVRKNINEKEIWILLDAIDSGYSIDNIIETKRDLFETIIEDCSNRDINVYIVVSANSYEMVSGESCLDTWSGNYITFKDYNDYKEYILKTRDRKNKRYE